MNERPPNTKPDALAELIRAAGRRPAPPRAHYEQVLAASRAAWRRKVAARRRRRWYALAASLAVAAGVGAMLTQLDFGAPRDVAQLAVVRGDVAVYSARADAWQTLTSNPERLEAGTRLRTGAQGGLALSLLAGGSLRLDASTELTLESRRVVVERGRLYFDSRGRAPSVPIVVDTAFGTVRNIGTQFELRATADRLRVRVRSGAIELETAGAAPVRGAAGEEVVLADSGALSRSRIAPDDGDWAWAQALAIAPDQGTIMSYLQWIAREMGKGLRFDAESTELSAELVSLSGDPRGLTPLELLRAIAATSDFGYRLTDDGAILISRLSR